MKAEEEASKKAAAKKIQDEPTVQNADEVVINSEELMDSSGSFGRLDFDDMSYLEIPRQ